MFILQKVKKPPNGFCTYLLFASAIILIFGGLFLHRISRIIKVKMNWIRVTTAEFSGKTAETGGITQIQVRSVRRQERSPPKATPKVYPSYYAKFQSIGYATYYLQSWNP